MNAGGGFFDEEVHAETRRRGGEKDRRIRLVTLV